VKDAVREYGRTVGMFAAAGLALSLLVGLLAGNPFGVMVLRAFLFAVVFGGLGAGMQYVVRRFLPEIAGGTSDGPQEADGAAANPVGSTIDIVLPEEPSTVEKPAEGRDELLEELPGTGEAAGAPAVEELEGVDNGAGTEPASGSPEAARGTGGLDALPDIGPIGTGGTARGSPRRPGARARPSDATRDVLERQDPAALARGLRTMLKREERP
jgi:hypothetical protein